MTKETLKCSASLTVQKRQKGITILYTSVDYAISNSGVNPPGIWVKDLIPTATDSQPFLWTRTIVMYSDGTSTTSYSVSKKGDKGNAGTSVRILGSLSGTTALNSITNKQNGDGYIIDGELWVYTGSTETGSVNGFVHVGKIQGPSGEDGLTFVISPSTITFTANENGKTNATENDGLGEEKNFTIYVFKNGINVANNCTFIISDTENFTKYNSSDNFYYITISNGNCKMYSGGVDSSITKFSDGKTYTTACTNGYVRINITYNKITYTVQVNFVVQMSAVFGKVFYDNEKLISEYQAIKGDYASKSLLQQTANGISGQVETVNKNVENINGRVSSAEKNITALTITSTELTSTVKNIKGDNILRGQNGVGWSNNVGFDSAGSTFTLYNSSEWYYAPAIQDYDGDFLLSFHKFGTYSVRVEAWAFDQIYEDDITYDVTIDKKDYDPDMTILATDYNYTSSQLSSYGANGYSGTWAVKSTTGISVGQKVALQVKNSSTNEYNYVYVTINSIDSAAGTITATSIDILVPAKRIFTTTTGVIASNNDLFNTMHYSKDLERHWVKFKELTTSNKTILIRFQPSGSSESGAAFLQKVMVETNVDEPHKYMDGLCTTQSMIKQTANEIIQQVGKTYVKIGDGNITLNGDTQINGSLTLNSSDQGFILVGENGRTEISPKSVGSFSDFSSSSQCTIKTNIVKKAAFGANRYQTNAYDFSWDIVQDLGSFPLGSYINVKNFSQSITNFNGQSYGTPTTVLSIYEDDTLKKTMSISNSYTQTSLTYTTTINNSKVKIIARTTKTVFLNNDSGTMIAAISPSNKIDNRIPLIDNATMYLDIKWDNIVPTSSGYMLVGNDGLAINFGTNKTVFIGKDGMIAKFGDQMFQVSSDGIYKNNRRNLKVISGSGTENSPISYTVTEPIDTVLCVATNAKVYFPLSPYEGQTLKILDKCSNNCYINTNGKRLVTENDDSSGTIRSNDELGGHREWQYLFANGVWYEERLF